MITLQQIEKSASRVNEWTLAVSVTRLLKRIENNDPHPNDFRAYGANWREAYSQLVVTYAAELRRRGTVVQIGQR